MRALMMRGKGLLVEEQVPEPPPGPEEALIEVERFGICGSDLVTLEGKRKISLPRILGHEFVGKIRSVTGGENYSFRMGDRVVAEPIIGCGFCRNCRNGEYNVCNNRTILGVEEEGVYAQLVRVPLHNIIKVPEGGMVTEPALAQPLAVAVHTLRRTPFQAGFTAAVLGAGPIGALIAMLAQAAGGTRIILSETNEFRRKLMEQMGFPVIDPVACDPVEAALLMLDVGDEGFDMVFDAAGAQATISQATNMVRTKGQVVLVATYREEPRLDIGAARKREINFISTRAHNFEDFRTAVALISSRQVDVRPLITHELDLNEIPDAIQSLANGGAMMKVLGRP